MYDNGFNMPFTGGRQSGLSERMRDPAWNKGKRDPYYNSRVLREKTNPKNKNKNKNKSKVGGIDIGFDPAKMAKTLTGLGYDTDIAAIQRSIESNKNSMANALRELHAWVTGTEKQRGASLEAINAAGAAAVQQQQANDANIANLFGGQAQGEALAGMRPGEDLISSTNLTNSAYLQNLAPVLASAGQERERATQDQYMQKQADLEAELRAKKSEKNQAYEKNYLDALTLSWDREKELYDRQVAKDMQALTKKVTEAQLKGQQESNEGADIANKTALAQLREWQKNSGLRRQQAEADLLRSRIGNKAANQQIKAAKVALQQAKANLTAFKRQMNGTINWADPRARQTAIQKVLAPFINETGALRNRVNPRLALNSIINSLMATPGALKNQAMKDELMAAFKAALINQPAFKGWVWDGEALVGPNDDPAPKGKGKEGGRG